MLTVPNALRVKRPGVEMYQHDHIVRRGGACL